MKYYCDAVIVVEGTNDSSYLSSFIDAFYIETNGYDIPDNEMEFLSNLPVSKKIIVLTDSDDAGKQIRERLNRIILNPINITVDIAKCNKNNKHGVAECDKQEIINVLKEHLCKETDFNTTITVNDLHECGVIDKESRYYLASQLKLGYSNNKALLKKINFLSIDKETILKVMEGYYGN